MNVVQVMRVFRFVMALRTLVTSIFHTLKALLWALILLFLIVYVFSVIFASAVNEALSVPHLLLPEREAQARRYFGSLVETMLTLFMSIAGGVSWEEVIAPLRAVSEVWGVAFLVFFSFTYFAVMNVAQQFQQTTFLICLSGGSCARLGLHRRFGNFRGRVCFVKKQSLAEGRNCGVLYHSFGVCTE